MAKSIPVKRKTRGRPATGTDPFIGIRLPQPMLASLDAWAQDNGITRSEAVRRMLVAGLAGKRRR
jgi:hypothetical protein